MAIWILIHKGSGSEAGEHLGKDQKKASGGDLCLSWRTNGILDSLQCSFQKPRRWAHELDPFLHRHMDLSWSPQHPHEKPGVHTLLTPVLSGQWQGKHWAFWLPAEFQVQRKSLSLENGIGVNREPDVFPPLTFKVNYSLLWGHISVMVSIPLCRSYWLLSLAAQLRHKSHRKEPLSLKNQSVSPVKHYLLSPSGTCNTIGSRAVLKSLGNTSTVMFYSQPWLSQHCKDIPLYSNLKTQSQPYG